MEDIEASEVFLPPIETPIAFPGFPKLPAELQTLIWQHSIPEPNVVTMRKAKEKMKVIGDGQYILSGPRAKASWRQFPAILHTCQLSRATGLTRYRPAIEKQLGCPLLFDFSQDLLLMTNFNTFAYFVGFPVAPQWDPDQYFDCPEADDIRFLAIVDSWSWYFSEIWQLLRRFGFMESVILGKQGWADDLDMRYLRRGQLKRKARGVDPDPERSGEEVQLLNIEI